MQLRVCFASNDSVNSRLIAHGLADVIGEFFRCSSDQVQEQAIVTIQIETNSARLSRVHFVRALSLVWESPQRSTAIRSVRQHAFYWRDSADEAAVDFSNESVGDASSDEISASCE